MNILQAEKLRDRIYERLAARRPDILDDEKYYRGEQPLSFATEEWRKANAARYAGFSDNWCGTVVNAEAERLDPIGVAGVGRKASSRLWDELRRNEFDSQFSQGAVTSLTTSRSYVMVWADADGAPLVTVEHPSHVEIEYDWENPRLRKAALKTWVDDSHEFATLYTADHVFKWERKRPELKNDREAQAAQSRSEASSGGGWTPRTGDRDDVWPIRNPLGIVPVVELANRPTLLGEPVSEIRGVKPMQDAINLLWAYLFLAADYASMPARVATATGPPTIPTLDDKGAVIGTRPVEMKDLAEKRLLFLQGENAKIDSWPAAELAVFTSTIEIGVGHIAAQTRTPPHYLVANKGLSNLSGDALTAAEIGLVQKANEFITFTNPSIREVLRLVALVRNDQKLAGKAQLATIVWKDREIRSQSQLADALLKKRQMGYPFEFLLEQEGHSPSTITRILQMREEELDDPQLAAALRPYGGDYDDSADGDSAVHEAAANHRGNGRGDDSAVGENRD
ncbi:phage portal protein [Leucobacter sp. M11]|uniref:phage portal protein n=1 Tax=Leucobacter sp. M11 TaxID=2993565 RepID=UPI002D7F1BE5|nr:phage portal protein [Leucobacter sp. M11]MEB4613991.1 phage portal protein [Leucobacter sp. M11]